MTSLTTSVCLTPGTSVMCWASCTCLLKSSVRYVDSEVGVGAHWLLVFHLTLRSLALGNP